MARPSRPRPTTATPWHALSVEEAARRLETATEGGLGPTEVSRRRERYGENLIRRARRHGPVRMLLAQFTDFMILVLVAAAVISGIVGEARDAAAIVVIVVLNAVIGFVLEFRAERALAALRGLAAPQARVLRAGRVEDIPARELVPGDLVLLEAGNLVPADLRLVQAEQLAADESALTGESQPVDKDSVTLEGEGLAPGDQRNMAFKGALVTRGRGRGLVVATGMHTELGRVARLLERAETVKTPLQQRLARFGRRLAVVVLAVCALVFAAGLLRGEPAVLMFLTAVSLAVAAIPEALPAVVTVSLALGAHKLVRRRALVRRLPAVETLGSVTYICADKTGTLTRNQMRAEALVVGGRREAGLTPELCRRLPWLGRALALSNDVMVDARGQPRGEPTELALYALAQAAGLEKPALEAEYPRVAEQPFDSERKRMATVHRVDGGFLALVKGAPEAVVPDCGGWAPEGESWSAESVLQRAEALASEGYRVLALAQCPLARPDVPLEGGLQLLALVALIDPPREESAAAVEDCRGAGITPVMITGDHPGTALAIARRVGIAREDAEVITGGELQALDEAALARCVERVRVYARVDPAQKIRIVRALQACGQFVAMTGDGVNDAPALKQADIGVAMGGKGTDVAREASDMVLLDDNFTTIVAAVREGRRIFDNIRKFVKYTMTSNAGEIWTLSLAPFMGLPIPLLPIHILWINLVTDGLPGLALAAEPAERDLMHRPPRPPKESIFAHGMWQHMLWVGLLIAGLSILGQAWAYHGGSQGWQTVVFTVLTFSQLAHALAIRSERQSLLRLGLRTNRPLLGAVLLTLGLQLAVIYAPPLNAVFKTRPFGAGELALCFALPAVVLAAVEMEKWLVRRGRLYGAGDG